MKGSWVGCHFLNALCFPHFPPLPFPLKVVTALGRTWHPEHFTCAHCNQELGTKNFFERDNEPYCETDYHNIFSPRCAYCNGPILDVSAEAGNLQPGRYCWTRGSRSSSPLQLICTFVL